MLDGDQNGGTTAPLFVTPIIRFFKCLNVLIKIFETYLPHIVIIRSISCLVIVCGFLEDSVSGFGSTLLVKGNIEYRIGTWSGLKDKNSSNWRVFEDSVCGVEQAGL